MRKVTLGLVAALLVASAGACADDDPVAAPAAAHDDSASSWSAGQGGGDATGAGGAETTATNGSGGGQAQMTGIQVSFERLLELGEDYEYEGWIIVDDAPVSTGRFDLDPAQDDYTFWVPSADAWGASAFVLTIEPKDDDDAGPSHSHVLAGDIDDEGSAWLSVDHPAAIGTDFADMGGSYILATPTSGDVAEDYDQGIWFFNFVDSAPAASLWLPELPEGWQYEGWVVGPNGPVSTGRFSAAEGADSDGAGPAAGSDGHPPFPGQDFIDPAKVIAGGDYAAVITVEPQPDDSAAPFKALRPLRDPSIDDVGGMVPQDLVNKSDENPTGMVTLVMMGG